MTPPNDTEIAMELAAELFNYHRIPPFVFGIYYDAKAGPAKVTVHRIVKGGTMGLVDFMVPTAARVWCEAALKEGYTVVRVVGRDETQSASLESRRRYYNRKQLTPKQRQDLDDEIPF